MCRSFLVLSCVGLAFAQAPSPVQIARRTLDQVLGQQYAEVVQSFTPPLQKAFPETTLAKLGTQLKNFGAVEKIGEPTVQKVQTSTLVVFPVKFASASLKFQFAVNEGGQIAGFVPLPGDVDWQHPAYSKPDTFKERDVTVGEAEWALPGTLTVPAGKGPFPAIALVHGSGPNDRDESVGGSKVFKDLAEGLASRGIVVLRYEKRTRQYGRKVAGLRNFTVQEETVEDAVKAAAVLRAQPEVDPKRVYILGHSLGGYLAPRIAAQDGKLAGVVIWAGNARPLEDLFVEQAEYSGAAARQLDAIKAQARRIKLLEPGDEDGPPILGMPAAYLIDLKGYDPPAEMKKLSVPVLVQQGERDFQATMADYKLWQAALGGRKDATFHSYPALNHLFIAGEGKSTEAEYTKTGHVAAEVIDDLAKFVK